MFNFSFEFYIYRGIAVLLSLAVHEMAHALLSFIMGDPTAKRDGRLTINPLAHIDWVGLLLMMIVGFGWAKPVPIDSSYYKDRKAGIVWTSFAGPMANFILSFLCVFIYFISFKILYSLGSVGNIIQNVLSYTATVSASIGIFNLIPIPPLDGSKVLFAVLPDDLYYRSIRNNQIWTLLLIVLIISRALSPIISMLTGSLIEIFSNFCLTFV